MKPLYLASGSPRRRELLAQIGVSFTAVSADIDETPLDDETPSAYVERLARGKAEAGRRALPAGVDGCVLGADTAVVLDGRILGKPLDRKSVVSGKSVSVRVALGGGGIIKKNKTKERHIAKSYKNKENR